MCFNFEPMKQVYLTFLLLSLSFLSYAGHEGSEKTTSKTVIGKITDLAGESIPGAKLIITQTGETFFADFDGNFKITVKTDVEYTVSINTIGYEVVEKKSSELGTFSAFSLKPL